MSSVELLHRCYNFLQIETSVIELAFAIEGEARRWSGSGLAPATRPRRPPSRRQRGRSPARANGEEVVKSLRYLLTNPRQFDILQFGPG